MNVESEIERLKNVVRDCGKKIRWLRQHAAKLKELPVGSVCGDHVDFDNLSHKEVIRVVRSLGGKWSKTLTPKSYGAEEGRVNYEAEFSGMSVRCWAGEPPPSCRVVEVEEHVPELVVPAHTIKVKKLICTGQGEPVVVAIARANAPLKANGE